MPLNLIKCYPHLLELIHMNEYDRRNSLKGIFDRDITNHPNLCCINKKIRPTKVDGVTDLDRVLRHLTTHHVDRVDESGKTYKAREFERHRSERLHWLLGHLEFTIQDEVDVFSTEERDNRKRKTVVRTYLFNETQRYVIVLEPQKSGRDYYLITAYHLNKSYGLKAIKKRRKKKLDQIH